MVAAEALERRVDRPPDVLARAAGSVPVRALHVVAELGRDDEVVRAARERLTDDALARAQSVDVGGVEERDAGVDGSGEDSEGRLTVDPATEVVAAETHAGDGEDRGTERCAVHRPIVCVWIGSPPDERLRPRHGDRVARVCRAGLPRR